MRLGLTHQKDLHSGDGESHRVSVRRLVISALISMTLLFGFVFLYRWCVYRNGEDPVSLPLWFAPETLDELPFDKGRGFVILNDLTQLIDSVNAYCCFQIAVTDIAFMACYAALVFQFAYTVVLSGEHLHLKHSGPAH